MRQAIERVCLGYPRESERWDAGAREFTPRPSVPTYPGQTEGEFLLMCTLLGSWKVVERVGGKVGLYIAKKWLVEDVSFSRISYELFGTEAFAGLCQSHLLTFLRRLRSRFGG